MTFPRNFLLVSAATALLVAGCAWKDESPQIVMRVIAPSAPAAMQASALITRQYIVEKRYLRVSIPEIASPTEGQTRAALSAAVVQPAFRESSPNDESYLMCTVHEARPELAKAMLVRCREQLIELARISGVSLAQEGAL